jgi:hypothetical protein
MFSAFSKETVLGGINENGVKKKWGVEKESFLCI